MKLKGADLQQASLELLMEVAGPRLHVSGVLGMPLLRVSEKPWKNEMRIAAALPTARVLYWT